MRVDVSHVVPQRHLIGRVRAEEGGGIRGLELKLLVASIAERPPSVTNKNSLRLSEKALGGGGGSKQPLLHLSLPLKHSEDNQNVLYESRKEVVEKQQRREGEEKREIK